MRPRARARACPLRWGNVGATPGAHLPTPPSMLPRHPLSCQEAKTSQARRQKSNAASSRPGVPFAGPLVAQQTLNDGTEHVVVSASVRQYLCSGDVAEQMLGAAPRKKRATARRSGGRGGALVSGASRPGQQGGQRLGRRRSRGDRWALPGRRSHAALGAGCHTKRPGPGRRCRAGRPRLPRCRLASCPGWPRPRASLDLVSVGLFSSKTGT